MTARDQGGTQGEACGCTDFLRRTANSPENPMAGLPGAMAVSTAWPLVTADEFPVQNLRCPHGERFYVYPTAERINALRALNGVN